MTLPNVVPINSVAPTWQPYTTSNPLAGSPQIAAASDVKATACQQQLLMRTLSGGRKHKSRKHKSRKHKSRKHKSRKHKSRKHKSRKYKSRKYKSRKYKSRKHKLQSGGDPKLIGKPELDRGKMYVPISPGLGESSPGSHYTSIKANASSVYNAAAGQHLKDAIGPYGVTS